MNSQKIKNSPAKAVVFFIVGLVVVLSIFPRARTIYDLSMRKEELLKKQQVIEAYNKELNNELQKSEDPEQVEKIAREKLGMIKPGERYIIPLIED